MPAVCFFNLTSVCPHWQIGVQPEGHGHGVAASIVPPKNSWNAERPTLPTGVFALLLLAGVLLGNPVAALAEIAQAAIAANRKITSTATQPLTFFCMMSER